MCTPSSAGRANTHLRLIRDRIKNFLDRVYSKLFFRRSSHSNRLVIEVYLFYIVVLLMTGWVNFGTGIGKLPRLLYRAGVESHRILTRGVYLLLLSATYVYIYLPIVFGAGTKPQPIHRCSCLHKNGSTRCNSVPMKGATVASILLLLVAHHVEISSSLATPAPSSSIGRRRWIRDTLAGLASLVTVVGTATSQPRHADAAPVPITIVDVEGVTGGTTPKTANPFVRFDTVSMVPDDYFTGHRSLYGFTERVLDGDTIRIRHVPGYGINTFSPPEPLQQRGIANDTLIVRLYAVDCPETAKKKDQVTQPFGEEAKTFTSDLLYHKMVKVTLLRRDRYGRAIGMVETVNPTTTTTSSILVVNDNDDETNMDVSMELARRGLAELYTGGGAEYNVRQLSRRRENTKSVMFW
jgi:endonuclease YncB( thermonuclease family)